MICGSQISLKNDSKSLNNFIVNLPSSGSWTILLIFSGVFPSLQSLSPPSFTYHFLSPFPCFFITGLSPKSAGVLGSAVSWPLGSGPKLRRRRFWDILGLNNAFGHKFHIICTLNYTNVPWRANKSSYLWPSILLHGL